MAIVEIIVIATKFFLVEFPKLLAKYKVYRLDKSYANKELAYEEAMEDYREAKVEGKQLNKLRALRRLGRNHKK